MQHNAYNGMPMQQMPPMNMMMQQSMPPQGRYPPQNMPPQGHMNYPPQNMGYNQVPPHMQQDQMMMRGRGGGGMMPNNMRGGGGRGGMMQQPPQLQQQQQQQNRNNEIGECSPVVHLRNVTPEVSQLSIQTTIQAFGKIKNIVMLRQKNQALIEMESTADAQTLVDCFKDPGYVEIDGRRVYVRFSLHTELTATQHTSKTLLVSMFNTQYDVSAATHITPSIVFQIFGNYGPVERIVVLPKNESSAQNHNRVQALVQFDTKENAQTVKNTLQGQPVTLGETITFTLDIQFSRMEEIKTSSPHNSLVVPKPGAQPQPGGMPPQQQQPMPPGMMQQGGVPQWSPNQ
jgi:RNA recognition motif-containing protein